MDASIPEALDDLAGVLGGGLLAVLGAVLLGRTALARLPFTHGKLTRAETWILSYGIGAAVLSAAVFALCALGWVYDATVLLLAAAVAGCWLQWGRRPSPYRASAGGGRAEWCLVLVPVAAYGALYLVHTLAPETRSDALGYHLGLVQRYYRAHGFVPITTSVYAHISQGAEMLYLLAYAIGRESAAKIVHFSFLAATVGGVLCLARRFGCALAGAFAGVVVFTCPVVIPDATSAYNDCALAFSLLLTFYLLAIWWSDRENGWLILLGLLIGFCFSVKYTGVVSGAAAIAAAGSLLARHREWKPAAKALALCGATAAVMGLPWLLKSALLTGNPLAPFFNDWFRNPYISVEWEAAYAFAMKSYQGGPFDRWEQLLSAPFELVLGERYSGSLGWTLALAPFALLAWRRPFGRALLAASLTCALPWFLNAGARFLIPSVMFGALALGLALESLPRRQALAAATTVLAFQCVTSWPAHRSFWYYSGLWSVNGFPWRAALRIEPQMWHLARNVEFYLLADRLNQLGGPETRVLSLFNLPEAYFRAELLVSYQGLENQDLADALLAPLDPATRPDYLLQASWKPQPLLGLRIRQVRAQRARVWSVSELRLLRSGEPLQLPGEAVASSFPHPWHALRPFDGDVFTTWNSREPPAPGMFLQVQFGTPLVTDGMELVHPRASARSQSALDIDGLQSHGEWIRLEAVHAGPVHRPASAVSGAASAAARLREARIAYVALNLHPSDPYYPQALAIASDPSRWGLRRVFVDRTAVLLKVLPENE